ESSIDVLVEREVRSAGRHDLVDDAEVVEDLERAAMDAGRPAVRVDLRPLVDDTDRRAMARELARHREAGGTGAHHENWILVVDCHQILLLTTSRLRRRC